MNQIFKDIYLFSDIDGTLGREDIGIPKKNIDAIKRFILKGGTFGVATGRYLSDLTDFLKDVPINGYSIINNGAAIYSFTKKEFLYNKVLPDKSIDYVKKISKDNLDWGIIAVNEKGYLNVNTKTKFDINFKNSDLSELKGPFYKFLFVVDKDNIKDIINDLNDNEYYKDVYFVQSGDNLFEMVLNDINKGNSLKHFCKQNKIDLKNTYFIGDNFNDKEIMQLAGTSACTFDTDKSLKQKCEFISDCCENGAVAKFIEYIENKVLKNIN